MQDRSEVDAERYTLAVDTVVTQVSVHGFGHRSRWRGATRPILPWHFQAFAAPNVCV